MNETTVRFLDGPIGGGDYLFTENHVLKEEMEVLDADQEKVGTYRKVGEEDGVWLMEWAGE